MRRVSMRLYVLTEHYPQLLAITAEHKGSIIFIKPISEGSVGASNRVVKSLMAQK
jgi:hypothetical protein